MRLEYCVTPGGIHALTGANETNIAVRRSASQIRGEKHPKNPRVGLGILGVPITMFGGLASKCSCFRHHRFQSRATLCAFLYDSPSCAKVRVSMSLSAHTVFKLNTFLSQQTNNKAMDGGVQTFMKYQRYIFSM